MLGVCLGNLGLARQKLGRVDDAYTALSEGIELLVEQHARMPAGAFLALRGALQLLLGEDDAAESDLLEADTLLQGRDARSFRQQFLLPLQVRLHAQRGQLPIAEKLLSDALQEAGELASTGEVAIAFKTCGEVVTAAKAGKLVNGHIVSELAKELRRAASARLQKSSPESARLLEI